MIIFAGTIINGFFAEEVCMTKQLPFEYLGQSTDIKVHTNAILSEQTVEYAVYDVSQYTNSASEVADNIITVMQAKNAKPVILASGFSPHSNMVSVLRNRGIQAFIFSSSATARKSDFMNYLEDYYRFADKMDMDLGCSDVPVDEDAAASLAAENPEQTHVCSIGFAGAMHRIGTTTQALQVAKLYLSMGMKPCYISLDDSDFVLNIGRYFSDSVLDEEKGKVTYAGVDMFYDVDKLPERQSMEYDCFIYDFGVFGSKNFNRVSFLEKERSFIVCGAKPSEILFTNKILTNSFLKNVNYVFSFVPQAEHPDILEMMEDLRDHTYFADYVPDPFSFSSSSGFYLELTGIQAVKEKTKKSLLNFFKRK